MLNDQRVLYITHVWAKPNIIRLVIISHHIPIKISQIVDPFLDIIALVYHYTLIFWVSNRFPRHH